MRRSEELLDPALRRGNDSAPPDLATGLGRERGGDPTQQRSRAQRALRGLGLALLILFGLALPELGARGLDALSRPQYPSAHPRFVELGREYPKLSQLIRDWSVLRLRYHDYYVYSPGPASSETVNFTSYFGARATPASAAAAEAQEVLWAFGGSTLQNLEADDELALANQLAAELNRAKRKVRVYNFGVAGYQSTLEAIKFQSLLRQVPSAERPTTALFYDGFNDVMYGYSFGAASMAEDISLKVRDLVERRYARVVLYAVSELLASHSVLWREQIAGRVARALYGSEAHPGRNDVGKAVSAYVTNVRMTSGICESLHIRCLFLLQPLLATKTPLVGVELAAVRDFEPQYLEFVREFYRRAAQELASQQGFVDLSHALDAEQQPQFFDLGHTSPYSGIALGKRIAERLLVAADPTH